MAGVVPFMFLPLRMVRKQHLYYKNIYTTYARFRAFSKTVFLRGAFFMNIYIYIYNIHTIIYIYHERNVLASQSLIPRTPDLFR